jgi:hypothetical protein
MAVISVNVLTGETTSREMTPEEIAAIAPPQPAPVPNLSFAQLMIGLVSEGWITTAEGEAWLTGTLPAPVLALIGTLPKAQRFAAKARALRPTIVERNEHWLA